MDSFIELLQSLPSILGPVMSTAMGLIALDLGLGVAIALRRGVFQWTAVIAFYRTNVFPFGVAAIVIAAAAQFISADMLPAYLADQIADLGTLIGVGPMFAYLILGSIIPNVKALVLGKFRWQITNPELDLPFEVKVADKEAVTAYMDDPPGVGPVPYADPIPAPDTIPPGSVDIAALNEDGTAVDHYDPDTLNHVGSESVPAPEADPMNLSGDSPDFPKAGAGL